jgi:hypothetical protein
MSVEIWPVAARVPRPQAALMPTTKCLTNRYIATENRRDFTKPCRKDVKSFAVFCGMPAGTAWFSLSRRIYHENHVKHVPEVEFLLDYIDVSVHIWIREFFSQFRNDRMEDMTYGPRVAVAANSRRESVATALKGGTFTADMAGPRVAPGIALFIMLVISLLLWAGIIGLVHVFWH